MSKYEIYDQIGLFHVWDVVMLNKIPPIAIVRKDHTCHTICHVSIVKVPFVIRLNLLSASIKNAAETRSGSILKTSQILNNIAFP